MGFSVEHKEHMTAITVTGRFDLEAAGRLVHTSWSNGQFTNPYLLLDMRGCDAAMSEDEFAKLTSFMKQYSTKRLYGRIAFVVRSEQMETIQAYREALGDTSYEIKAFSHPATAESWLETML